MIRLFYVSTASQGVDSTTVDAIANESADYNAEHGITGALGYRKGVFGQVLEGEEADVEAVMKKIASDSRHTGIVEVGRITVDDRAFYDWGMKRLEGPSFNDLLAVMLELD